eukprot:CAMPEP_0178903416 /NCGR_PEP_ID=MMETSP0786-20121207/5143_1 /TAXON_ID=186022 /ORGANISM="Thalassionema frauenfeldii, Strain CCMP 1798" /LENGTH=422 /DNA_ID=CAMNT_0020574781 /DNA_START=49 /DNA_END=1317 /DNA_ORIENTATION=-
MTTASYIEPSNLDVLCARGKRAYMHPGNVWMNDLLVSKNDEFNEASSRFAKSIIVRQCIQALQERGGLFLREETLGSEHWVEAEFERIRDKISHALRHLTRERAKLDAIKKLVNGQDSIKENNVATSKEKSKSLSDCTVEEAKVAKTQEGGSASLQDFNYTKDAGAQALSEIIHKPKPQDVICTLGKFAYGHEGNMWLQKLMMDYQDGFLNAENRFQKSVIVRQCIQSVLARGGRFLKEKIKGRKDAWVIASWEDVRDKVSHAFRRNIADKRAKKVREKKTSELKVKEVVESLERHDTMLLKAMDSRGKRTRGNQGESTNATVKRCTGKSAVQTSPTVKSELTLSHQSSQLRGLKQVGNYHPPTITSSDVIPHDKKSIGSTTVSKTTTGTHFDKDGRLVIKTTTTVTTTTLIPSKTCTPEGP